MQIGLRDRSRLSPVVLSLSPAALQILARMDGTRTREEIRRECEMEFGRLLNLETVDRMIAHLDDAMFLDGPTFDTGYEAMLDAYRAEGVRHMPSAASSGIVDDSGEPFRGMLTDVAASTAARRVTGLVAPHLDYPRGRPCYVAAYAQLRDRPAPTRIVILGTNHFGRATSVVATGNDFETPLGFARVDRDFLARLEQRCGPMRGFELDHVGEHSIELQVVWLQFLFGAGGVAIVPVLCPDPCGPTGIAPCDGRGVDLLAFARALTEVVSESSGETLLIAGADLSHVGAAFGDDRPLDEDFLGEVEARDRRAISFLERADPEGFRAAVAENGNTTRVCSAGCMFVLASMLAGVPGRMLRYTQAVDEPTQTCVTCAALVYPA